MIVASFPGPVCLSLAVQNLRWGPRLIHHVMSAAGCAITSFSEGTWCRYIYRRPHKQKLEQALGSWTALKQKRSKQMKIMISSQLQELQRIATDQRFSEMVIVLNVLKIICVDKWLNLAAALVSESKFWLSSCTACYCICACAHSYWSFLNYPGATKSRNLWKCGWRQCIFCVLHELGGLQLNYVHTICQLQHRCLQTQTKEIVRLLGIVSMVIRSNLAKQLRCSSEIVMEATGVCT